MVTARDVSGGAVVVERFREVCQRQGLVCVCVCVSQGLVCVCARARVRARVRVRVCVSVYTVGCNAVDTRIRCNAVDTRIRCNFVREIPQSFQTLPLESDSSRRQGRQASAPRVKTVPVGGTTSGMLLVSKCACLHAHGSHHGRRHLVF